jgi:hypothetical protein
MADIKKTIMRMLILAMVYVTVAILTTGVASGTELYIPATKTTLGQPVDVPVMIDDVENMAGLKLVMKYDQKILTFKKGVKTKHSDSLMHIINDKKPGILIVVMAGARGIKGKEFAVLNLIFEAKGGSKENRVTTIEITEIEMMSDKLKDIACQVKTNPLVISPQPATAPAAEKTGNKP